MNTISPTRAHSEAQALLDAMPPGDAAIYDVYLIAPKTSELPPVGDALAKNFIQLRYFESAEAFLIDIMRHPVHTSVARIAYMNIAQDGMTGLEALNQIQKLEPGIRVILLADQADAATILNAWHIGASDFILAPYTAQKITDGMKRAVRSRPPLQQASRSVSTSDCQNVC